MKDNNIDMFEQFESQLINLNNEMKLLLEEMQSQEHYLESVNTLFRHFHSIKATVSYLNYEDTLKIVKKTEEVLGILRNYKRAPSNRTLFSWLEGVRIQISIWVNEIDTNDGILSEVSEELLKALQFNYDSTDPKILLKRLTLLIVIKNEKLRTVINENFSKFFKSVYVSDNAKDGFKKYLYNQPSFIISDFNLNDNTNGFAMLKKVQQADSKLPVILLFDTYNRSLLMKLSIYGISALTKPLKLGQLYSQVVEKIQIRYGAKRIKMSNETIQKVVEDLKPLPDSILRVQRLCDSPDTSVRDVIQEVKRDAIFSALILKEANMPIYGNQGMDSIERAVSFFGKRAVKALSLAEVAMQMGSIDLECYGIDSELFFKVSQLRMRLMISWYSKISIADLNILATTAVLGNIGQIIIAREIDALGRKEEFLEITKEEGSYAAEEQILNVSTAEVTADVLSYWELDRMLVDAIRYSDNLEQAPEEILSFAVANYIVFQLVPPNFHSVSVELPEQISELMEKHDLASEPLLKALERLVLST